ncbi:PspA/IM30 family protein [Bacillus sp. JCM 19034]|uniref:PspA/IM30 family protein n=1 Tax=Bacillus sp. JCM 19034 TaxID=1481928 RepID=UPI0007829AF4|nr:PspA/IM30 family protein [Bacillus sp. JCM 19034]
MDVAKRIEHFFKAYVNEGLERIEDPVIMVKQYMRDVKTEITKRTKLIEKRQHLSLTLKEDAKLLKEKIEKRETQAKQALENGDEELAKKLLLNKHDAYDTQKHYEALYERNEEQLVELKVELEELHVKYQKLKERKLDLLLRMEAVQANQTAQQYGREKGRRSHFHEDPFQLWEERIIEMERTVGKQCEQENVEMNQKVMAELENLKGELKEKSQ